MNMQGTRQSYVVRNSSPGMPVMPLLTNTGGPRKEGWVLTCPPLTRTAHEKEACSVVYLGPRRDSLWLQPGAPIIIRHGAARPSWRRLVLV